MALSYVQYEGNGTQQTFAIPFPYLDKSHIEVRVALDVTSYTWDDPNTIRISPAPAAGAVVEARRVTPRDNRMVDFVDGSVLTESDLDLATIQTFYIVQEAIDIAGGTLELLPDGSYGAGGRRIKEVGTPVEARDAVTKEYHDGTWVPQLQALVNEARGYKDTAYSYMNTALSARDAAIAARDAANASKNAAATSEGNAASSASAALASKNAAKTSEDNAAGSAYNAAVKAGEASDWTNLAKTHRDDALAHRNAAQGFRNEAETFKNQAAQSAANAQTWDPNNYVPKAGGVTVAGDMSWGNGRADFYNYYDYTTTLHFAKAGVGDFMSVNSSRIVSFTGRPVFNGATPWDSGNFNPATKRDKGDGSFTTNITTTGYISASGVVYSGNAYLAQNGNIYGTSWGGWISDWVINNFRSNFYGTPVTVENFTGYFTMRKTPYGQQGAYTNQQWTGSPTLSGPAGCFLTSVYIDFTGMLHYGYYYILQWHWSGGWYTIQG